MIAPPTDTRCALHTDCGGTAHACPVETALHAEIATWPSKRVVPPPPKPKRPRSCSARVITYRGERLTTVQWAARIGVTYSTIAYRVDRGMRLDMPPRRGRVTYLDEHRWNYSRDCAREAAR